MLSEQEIQKLDKIKRDALVDDDYGEIPMDTVFSLVGAVPWLCKIIDRLAGEQEAVHARWEPDNIDGCCTACGQGKPCDSYGDYYESDFCQGCGAKMDADAPERGEGSGT